MNNHRVACVVSIFTIALLSLSLFVVMANAQYQSQQTTPITVDTKGVAHVDQSSTGGVVSIDIAGSPGSTGSISTATFNDNPQPGASSPVDTKLTNFIVITINMNSADFYGANLVFHYSDSTVASITSPYSLYKYVAASNSYVLQNAIVDTNAQTITLTISSLSDPLFAIGGAPAPSPSPSAGTPGWIWLALVLVVIIVVAAVVLLAIILQRRRKPTFETIE